MKKRGQFYLIAVVILIAVFLGILTISNSISTADDSSVYDIEKELQIEKGKVLDHIAKNNLDSTQSLVILSNFSNTYIEKIGKNKNMIFVAGDSSNLRLIANIDSNAINYSSGDLQGSFGEGEYSTDIIPQNDEIQISISGNDFTYEINPGQNIYYIIEHEYNEGMYYIKS